MHFLNKEKENLNKTKLVAPARPRKPGSGLAALFGPLGYEWNNDYNLAQQFKANMKAKNVRNISR